jgi:hypothetical protein
MSMSRLATMLASAFYLASSGEPAVRGDRHEVTIAAVAGDYYLGDGLGVNCSLKLGPDDRFSFGWRGCLGVYDQNAGVARVEAGHLILKTERPNAREGFRGTPTDFIPVRWGARLYLIPEGDGREFCNAVNQGTEPRAGIHGRFYLRRGDWEKKAEGRPDVPEAWKPLLLTGPLRGRVFEVLGGDRARVDLGSDVGVWRGMEMWSDAEGFGLVEIVEVGAKSSVAVTKYPGVDRIRFKVGQGVRSRLSDEK